MNAGNIKEIKEITEKLQKFRYSTAISEDADFDEIKDFNILFDTEKSVCVGVINNNVCNIHWASDEIEDFISEIEKIPHALYSEFIPLEAVEYLESAGFEIASEWIDFFSYDIKSVDIHNQKYEDIEFLSSDEINEAMKISRECENQSRGFNAETCEWFAEWMSGDDKNNIIKVTEVGVIAGTVCVSIYNPENPTLWIRRIEVRPDMQNNGFGKKLIEAAFCYGIYHGAVRSFLHADVMNKNAIDLYRKYGFENKYEHGQINMKRNTKLI